MGSADGAAVGPVVIGMDPHKRSATIEVMDAGEVVLDGGRYATDVAGYRPMLTFANRFGIAHGRSRAARVSGSISRSG
jgi:hypothetical protein